MIIGFDLDDVVLDFHGALHPYYNSRFGTDFRKEHFASFDVSNVWGCSREETVNRILDFYQSLEHRDASPIDGAVEGIKSLKKFNDLHIVTAKPEDLKDRTLEWLDRHFPGIFNGVHFANHLGNGPRRGKGKIANELGIEIFVDDSLDNAEDVSSHGIPVLLFDAPWNQGVVKPLITRVYSWEEIVKVLSR